MNHIRSLFHRAGTVLLLCASTAAFAIAQQTTPAGIATLRGVVIDSVRGRVLSDALVELQGTTLNATTDSAGRFEFANIAAGNYRVAVSHAFLDSIGVRIATSPISLPASDTLFTVVAVPSAATLARVKCGPGVNEDWPAAVIGMVTSSDDDEPVAGVTVVVRWTQLTIRARRILSEAAQRSAVTDDEGRFRICGLPSVMSGTVVAVRGADTTIVVPVQVEGVPLEIVSLSLPSASDRVTVDSAARPATGGGAPELLRSGRGVLQGTVKSETGAPLPNARVHVVGTATPAVTDSSGRFRLEHLPTGSQRLVVRRIGYSPKEIGVNVAANRPVDVEVTMSDRIAVLQEVVVRGRMDAGLGRVGFARRYTTRLGSYRTPEQLAARPWADINDVVQTMRPLRRILVNGRTVIVGRPRAQGYGCVTWFVDGTRWLGFGTPNDYMHPSEIGAVEVYSSITTPPQYATMRRDCDTILLWTKTGLGVPVTSR